MAKTTIISSISRNTTYPVTQTISAPNNCGMLILKVYDSITDQMIYELPNINVTIYTASNIKIKSFDINLTTFSSDKRVISKKKQYAIPVYNIPNSCIISIKPLFDNNSIYSHNQLIDNGIIDSNKWDPTTNFNIAIYFDDSAVKSGIHSDVELWPDTTITGVPPIYFRAKGDPLTAYSIAGNMVQTGTPTPDNPIQPTFCGVRTANLCSVSAADSIAWAKKQDDILAIINALPVGTYTLSYTATLVSRNDGSDSSLYGVRLYKDNTQWQFLNQWGDAEAGDAKNGSATFEITAETVGQYTAFYLYGCGMNQGGATGSADFSNIMLNTGSTALPYEPYGWSEKITNAGQTVPVYLGQTETVRLIKKLVLTGEETWAQTQTDRFRTGLTDKFSGIAPVCTHYIGSTSETWNGLRDGEVSVSITTNLAINDQRFENADDFKSYLAQQYAVGTPITVWYVLAEPTTGIVNEPLCKIGDYADELHSEDAGVTIPTVKGDNTLTVESELQPSEVSITGKIKQ